MGQKVFEVVGAKATPDDMCSELDLHVGKKSIVTEERHVQILSTMDDEEFDDDIGPDELDTYHGNHSSPPRRGAASTFHHLGSKVGNTYINSQVFDLQTPLAKKQLLDQASPQSDLIGLENSTRQLTSLEQKLQLLARHDGASAPPMSIDTSASPLAGPSWNSSSCLHSLQYAQ